MYETFIALLICTNCLSLTERNTRDIFLNKSPTLGMLITSYIRGLGPFSRKFLIFGSRFKNRLTQYCFRDIPRYARTFLVSDYENYTTDLKPTRGGGV